MEVLMMVITHKQCRIKVDDVYKPIIVGNHSINISGAWHDNTGDNISDKNKNYCELTGLYWAWKNVGKQYDYIGLCHYRRYFTKHIFSNRLEDVLSKKDILKAMQHYDAILPVPYYWGYEVKNKYHEYNSGIGKEKDLLTTEEVIKKLYPDYLEAWDKVINRKHASYCNMFVLKRVHFMGYCEWLFNILSHVEKLVDISTYNVQESRIFGYLGEILLNVWVEKNKLHVKYFDYAYIDRRRRSQIRWAIKARKERMLIYFENREKKHEAAID